MKKADTHNSKRQPSKSQHESNILDNSAHAQRARLLAALRERPVTTLQARKELDILHPAGRAMELRKRGYNIVTAWTYAETLPNKLHRIGRYCLIPKKAKGAKQ